VNIINKPDGKVHRHPDGGYTLACATLLDGKLATVNYRTLKGLCGGGQRPYWVTEATVAFYECDGTQYPVHTSKHGLRTVKNGFTKKQALDVFHLGHEGFVLRGDVAVRAKFAHPE
jgi:hypothetical protein